MKKLPLLFPLALAALCLPLRAEDKSVLKDQKDKAGYSIGANIGASLKQDGVDVNIDALIAGLKDSLNGSPAQLTPEQERAALGILQTEMSAKATAQRKEAGDKAKKDGEAFLAANKSKDGVKTLPSGLQYKILTDGTGPLPSAADKVTVNYRGTLIDGTEFDNSYKRGEPATFGVNEVIPGWSEALPLMKTGSKWQIFVPAALAYGEKGAGRDIPPNATLVFEIELLGVKS